MNCPHCKTELIMRWQTAQREMYQCPNDSTFHERVIDFNSLEIGGIKEPRYIGLDRKDASEMELPEFLDRYRGGCERCE